MEAIDDSVRAAIVRDVLSADLVDQIVTTARQVFEKSSDADTRDQWRRELLALEREQGRLTEALAAGADAPVLIARLRETETKRRDRAAALATRAEPPEARLARDRAQGQGSPPGPARTLYRRRDTGARGAATTAHDADSVHADGRRGSSRVAFSRGAARWERSSAEGGN
jgi:hypothetical protein